jgi:hypothetical protein
MTSPLCLRHRSSPVVAVCHVCGEGLCDACWTFVGDGKPVCAQCVHVWEWAAEKRWSRLVVFVIVGGIVVPPDPPPPVVVHGGIVVPPDPPPPNAEGAPPRPRAPPV